MGMIGASGQYACIAQKYSNDNYASGLVFGYNSDKLYFQRKQQGSWQAIREI
jgi:hypothetical protein